MHTITRAASALQRAMLTRTRSDTPHMHMHTGTRAALSFPASGGCALSSRSGRVVSFEHEAA